MKALRSRLTFANVISCVALFIALGGLAVAAGLPKNSVGSKQLKKNSVTSVKVKDQTLTGKDINLAKLGTVPSATNAAHATLADSANAISPPEAIHQVGAPGEPPFLSGSGNDPSPAPGIAFPPVGFYKDHEGIVHLEGVAKIASGSGPIFVLPPGYRPAPGVLQIFEPSEGGVLIFGSEYPGLSSGPGSVVGIKELVGLSGITFRALG